MNCREFFLQPNWVLESASRNLSSCSSQLLSQPSSENINLLNNINQLNWQTATDKINNIGELLSKYPSNLVLYRLINQLFTSQLPEYSLSAPVSNLPKFAVVIPGELRCFESSYKFLSGLSKFADIFICTNNEFTDKALSLSRNVYIIENEPELEVASMHQWHKLYMCLGQVKRQEVINKCHYEYILKLRTDFYLVKPQNILQDLMNAKGKIICSSDKIFGGSRDTMMLFEGFYLSLLNTYFGKNITHQQFNLQQILRSDDSFKWYGFKFPTDIFGIPNSVEALREKITSIVLANPNYPFKNFGSTENTFSFFKGHNTFPSEICFARFINSLGIPVQSSAGFQGFLREDRFQ